MTGHAGLASIICLSALAAGCGRMEDRFKPLAAGDRVPAYAARTISGDTVRVGPGQPAELTLLNVWATWCVPCQQEFPDLQRIHADYAPRGLRVVAVSVDTENDDAKVTEFARKYSATFTIAHDSEGRIRDLYRSIGIPESYLISADGTLLLRNPGAFPEGAANIREAIDKALRQ